MLQKAIEFAVKAHAGAVRKGTDIPYIVHPVEVMKIVAGITDDEEVRAAAVLHDTVEDTGTTIQNIRQMFGERVAELVGAESENKREGEPEPETWKIRKEETLSHLKHADRDVKIICLGDKLANMRDICRDAEKFRKGGKESEFWGRFNAPDEGKGVTGKKANIGWYYRGIADGLKDELGKIPEWEELDELVKQVFEIPEL